MIRYWFEFNFNDYMGAIPPGLHWGCGLTAFSYDHALTLLKSKVFKHDVLPKICKCVKEVNINTLDQAHVIRNMSPLFI